MRIVFMATPQFAVPALRHLVLNGYQVAAVYTRPDKQAGRGRHMLYSPVKQAALELALPVLQPDSLKKAEVVADLAGLRADVIVVAAYGQILPPQVLQLPGCGCINIHPSLLPRHRGASPVAAAILAGDAFTGVSIMLMDEGLDTGPVIAKAQLPVLDNDTTGSLGLKLSLVAARLLPDVLPDWIKGRFEARPQPEDGVTYSGTIDKEDGRIDWQEAAVTIWRKVRAFQPWPGCHTSWRGRTLKIIEVVPLPDAGDANAGQVMAISRKGFAVATGDGILRVLKLQLEGKRVVTAAEFLAGQRNFIGALLPD